MRRLQHTWNVFVHLEFIINNSDENKIQFRERVKRDIHALRTEYIFVCVRARMHARAHVFFFLASARHANRTTAADNKRGLIYTGASVLKRYIHILVCTRALVCKFGAAATIGGQRVIYKFMPDARIEWPAAVTAVAAATKLSRRCDIARHSAARDGQWIFFQHVAGHRDTGQWMFDNISIMPARADRRFSPVAPH